MAGKPSITVVGAGNLARALVPALRRAGYRLDEIVSRDLPASRQAAGRLARKSGARAVTVPQARLGADILWLCVTDDALARTAAELAASRKLARGTVAFHSSGALASSELAPLAEAGAAIASVHPMMTFVAGASARLEGIAFALEGQAAAVRKARQVVRDLGGEPFSIRAASKPLYHALGAFSSPLIIATLANAERVAAAAGVPRRLVPRVIAPILEQTLANYRRKGTAGAFSGPVARGDLLTVAKHLRALAGVPGALAAYKALVGSAILNLPVRRKAELARLLQDSHTPRGE